MGMEVNAVLLSLWQLGDEPPGDNIVLLIEDGQNLKAAGRSQGYIASNGHIVQTGQVHTSISTRSFILLISYHELLFSRNETTMRTYIT